ncbi:MAG: lysophospholipid acyltransferase family protein [Pseudomonadota bacterium]
MQLARSLLFTILFYVNTAGQLILFSYILFLPQETGWAYVRRWSKSNMWLLDKIVGVKSKIIGTERIPKGPLLIAAKHHSTWETFALLPEFRYPTYILKRELKFIPVFGWFTTKFRMIPVHRGKGAKALEDMTKLAIEELARDRQIIIFPEGTRKNADADPAYKTGVARLYRDFGVTCLPIALNSGRSWPRKSPILYPGTITAEILEPIEPGLDQSEFMALLEERIETATNRLLQRDDCAAFRSG